MLRWSCHKKVLLALLKISVILVGLPFAVLLMVSPVNAATYTVKVTVQNQNGLPVPGAFVVLQRCWITWTSTGCPLSPTPYDTYNNVIETQETDAHGIVSFAAVTNYTYRIVATKDYYTCVTTNCTKLAWEATAQPVSKTITLNEPDLTQVKDYGCTPMDVANGASTQRPRNNEDQRKVTENGVYWGTSYSYTNTIKWMKLFSSDYHAWNYPLFQLTPTPPPDAPLPQTTIGSSGIIFKLDQNCSNNQSSDFCGPADYTSSEIITAAQANPGSWWILGEDPNSTIKPMNANTFATWYHAKSQLVLQGDRTAKFIFGYFAQINNQFGSTDSDPTDYTRQVFAAWKTLAAQNQWCPEPPIDAIHSNFYPFTRWDGGPLWTGDNKANPNNLLDYLRVWRSFLYDGTGDAWLANERLSIGTGVGELITDATPTTEQTNYYSQASAGQLLDPSKNHYPYILFLMNYAGHNGEIKSNQEEGDCGPSVCSTPPAAGITRYGRVFGNIIYRNAGWEKQNLENWNQENQNGGAISTYSLPTSSYPTPDHTFYVTETPPSETNVTSFSTLKFIDDTGTSCAAQECWIRSDKIPLPPLAAQAQTFRYGLDYSVTHSTAEVLLQIRFFDSTGNNQIGSNITCNTGFVGSGNWTPFECPVGTTPTSPAQIQMSIRIIPQTAGANTKVLLDNAWARFEAP